MQGGAEMSIHDIVEDPLPYDKRTEAFLTSAVASLVASRQYQPQSLDKVCRTYFCFS